VPNPEKLRRGSVGILLVLVFCVMMVLLPLGTEGLYRLHDWVLLQRAGNYLEEVLPAGYNCLNSDALADGHMAIDPSVLDTTIRQRFYEALPSLLKNRLLLASINLRWQTIPNDPNHWMGANQPRQLPVMTMTAVLVDHHGQNISLEHSIELLFD
jgi:hypothetical protein